MSKKAVIFLGFFLILLISLSFIYYKRISVYPYDVEKNYTYDFQNTKSKIILLKLSKNNTLSLKQVIDKNKTAFLQLDIKSTLTGKAVQPFIKLSSDKKSIKSYFETGAKGTRYINLSSFPDTNKILLSPKYLKITDKDTKLILFKNPILKNKKILIIAPHPDDAEIAAFGLYSRYNKHTYIVTVTAGDAGLNNYDEIYHEDTNSSYFEKAKLRVINSFTVPLIGGIPAKNCINLGYFDSTLKKLYKNKNTTVPSVNTGLVKTSNYRIFNQSPLISELNTTKNNWVSLVSDLKKLLKKIKPDIIITPYPAIDAHPDHQYSSIALFEAIKALKIKDISLLLYTNHFNNCEMYPFGKIYSTVSLPPITDQKLYFDSVYSYQLSKKQQREKVLALEAMNDLRLDTEWRSVKGSAKTALKNLVKNYLFDNDERYFRRAVRENEIFFVIDSKSLYDTKLYNQIIRHF